MLSALFRHFPSFSLIFRRFLPFSVAWCSTHQSRLQYTKSTVHVTQKLRRQLNLPTETPTVHYQNMLHALGGGDARSFDEVQPYHVRPHSAKTPLSQGNEIASAEMRRLSSDLSSGISDPRAPFYDPCASSYTQSKHRCPMCVLSHCTRWFYPHRLLSVEYLSDPEVQEALHVGASSLRGKLGYTGEWAQCNDMVNEAWSFTDFLADTTYLYSRIYNHAKKPDGFKMLVFSGDNDGVSLCVLCILSVSVPPG